MDEKFVREFDQKGLLKRNFDNPPLKDTVSMPTKGYANIRFIADNPGLWLLNCHLETHNENGMAIGKSVGKKKDLPKKPEFWPRSGEYNSQESNSSHETST